MQKFGGRALESTTTTGTGNITLLGAQANYNAMATEYKLNERFPYTIQGQAGGVPTEWESGLGYLSASNTFVREIVHHSSNANAAVNFSAGTKDIFPNITGNAAGQIPSLGDVLSRHLIIF